MNKLNNVNYLAELEPFMYLFPNYKIQSNKIISCSPFRTDKHPSFAINLENGTFIDSGSQLKGGFVSLLSFLRNEDYENTQTYLIEKYDIMLQDPETLKIDLTLENVIDYEKRKKEILNNFFEQYANKMPVSPYLLDRGISQLTQEIYSVIQVDNRIIFPVYNRKDEMINIKYRSTENKMFWNSKIGLPVKSDLYGLKIAKSNRGACYLVESEIDVLSLAEFGIYGVGSFGVGLNDEQINIIKNTFERLYILYDNDTSGKKYTEKLLKIFQNELPVYYPDYNLYEDNKDVNDLLIKGKLENVLDNMIQKTLTLEGLQWKQE